MFTCATTFCEGVRTARPRRPVGEYAEAIAAFFFELPQWLDIRPLWRRDATSFWRVNFWRTDTASGEERICRSAFIAVEETMDALHVEDLT